MSYATETVMQLCHGKRSCELSADVSTFGSPCKPQSRMYLKVIYTCGKFSTRCILFITKKISYHFKYLEKYLKINTKDL